MNSNLLPGSQGTTSPGVNASIAPNGWTRRDRPCDACRRRKSRCIIPQDAFACVMCQSRTEECTFNENPQRRKRRRVDGEEPSPNASSSNARSPDAERNINVQPPISDYTGLPNSLLRRTLGLQNRQHGQYLGQTTEYDTRLINLTPFNGRGECVSTPGTLRRVSPQTHFIMKSESQEDVDDELANLDLVESIVQPYGRALVDLYFRIIHPSYPIMHKKVFLEKYNRSYREFTPPMLASVYILALSWWSYSPHLVNLPKPDIRRLESMAPKMMSDVLNRPKLSTVQAGLLFLQRPGGDSWALTGQLIAVAQNLGLHLDCSRWKIPEWERSLRKRLAWALYMQDKWGALVHGRPTLVHRDDWAVKSVELKDFPETAEDDDDEEGSAEIEEGRQCFIHMIALTGILTDVLDAFYTLRASMDLESQGENTVTATLERAKPIQLKLKEWYSTLPSSLAIAKTRTRKLSSTGSLHVAYFTIEVTLHRSILRFDYRNSNSQLRGIIRSAAKMRFTSAVDLINKLEPAHLQSFWYFASKVNLAIIATFGSLLWATSETPEEAEFYKGQLAEFRWRLRVSSKAAEFMAFTVGMLDTSAVFLKEGPPKVDTSSTKRETMVDHEASKSVPEPQTGHQDAPRSSTTSHPDISMSNSISTSVGISSEPAHQPEHDVADTNLSQQPWPTFTGSTINKHMSDGMQDWSEELYYDFEGFQDVHDTLIDQRFVEEYDEAGNSFGGF